MRNTVRQQLIIDGAVIGVIEKTFLRQHQRGYHKKLLLVVYNIGIDGQQIETPLGEVEIRHASDCPENMIYIIDREPW